MVDNPTETLGLGYHHIFLLETATAGGSNLEPENFYSLWTGSGW